MPISSEPSKHVFILDMASPFRTSFLLCGSTGS
jgi:hypothetical protein